jgi:hypothetical protein
MKIKILSQGLPFGTQVVNAETGEGIENVTKVEWVADIKDSLCRCKIEVFQVPVEIEGEIQND